MIGKAMVRYLRISPRKVAYVIAPLRRRTVAEAIVMLGAIHRRAAKPILKAVSSAFANARQRNPALREEEVVISRLVADEGPTWKRFRAAPFGRTAPILKRTTHVTVELDRGEPRQRRHGAKG